MRILGMVTHTHDTGVAVIEDGAPTLVIEEERLNREKKTLKFPAQALAAAVTDRGLKLKDFDAITIPWDIPRFWRTLSWALLRKFPTSLQLVHMRAHPPQQNQLFRGKRYLRQQLCRHFGITQSDLPPMFGVGHHHSHAASFFVSPFDDATVLVMDGYGDDASTSVYRGTGNQLTRQWHTHLFNSLGIFYSVITQYLGFHANHDEGKVMGLAAYGGPTYVAAFRDLLKLEAGGKYQVNMDYFSYDCYGMAKPWKTLLESKFGPPRGRDEPLTDRHRDIAYALQATAEETILHLVRGLTATMPSRNLVLVGGVALNCVANARILEETAIREIWVPPNPSDTGATMGSALWHHYQVLGNPRSFTLTHPYYGLEYSDAEIEASLEEFGLDYERVDDGELSHEVARELADGKIVSWFQGRFEMGPRALGNRSILADPRRANMKDTLNRRVKHRESFRPFAPAVLRECVSDWFHIGQGDPFMTIAPRIRQEQAYKIPAAVHADGTGRIQTVERAANPRYYDVIKAFGAITGVPILLNTSFNRQEPIVSRPSEAISCFLRTDMDLLVLGNYLCRKPVDGESRRRDVEEILASGRS
jgi:carbamoyltransferase